MEVIDSYRCMWRSQTVAASPPPPPPPPPEGNPTFTSLASGAGVNDATTIAIPSLTLTANRLCLLAVINTRTNSSVPTCAGWVLVRSYLPVDGGGGSIVRLTVFRRMVDVDTTQGYTVDFSGETQAFTKWAISQSSAGVDTSGTNGSGAVVQSAQNGLFTPAPSPTTPQYDSVTLAAFANAVNSTFAVFGGSYADYVPTVGSGFTQLAIPGVGSFEYALITEYKAANDTVADATWSGEADVWVGIALEVRATPGPVPDAPVFVVASGSTAGQKTITCDSPATLVGGGALSGDPVTSYRFRVRRVDTDALVGGTPVDDVTTTKVITGLPAVAMYATVAAINSSGESDESVRSAEWTGT